MQKELEVTKNKLSDLKSGDHIQIKLPYAGSGGCLDGVYIVVEIGSTNRDQVVIDCDSTPLLFNKSIPFNDRKIKRIIVNDDIILGGGQSSKATVFNKKKRPKEYIISVDRSMFGHSHYAHSSVV